MSQTTTARPRSAAGSRARLLKAAGELFAERGYERTTVRDLGQRAGVDPTMIARYFGGKAALYLASLRHDTGPASTEPLDLASAEAIQRLLDRVGARGPTPTLYAAVHPHDDDELQNAAMDVLDHRIVQPSERIASAAGQDDSRLRAEIATAALAGIILSRTSNAFATLGSASSADVGRLIAQMLDNLLQS
jgi:AcrR family transcriptional regulator